MDDISIFTNKDDIPTNDNLVKNQGTTYVLWKELEEFVIEKYPNALAEWNFPGKKYGYSFRIKDKRRAILYFLPRKDYFKIAFVFGQKATDIIMGSDVETKIKTKLAQARKYAEGRGIRIDVKNESPITDIKKLVAIKLSN